MASVALADSRHYRFGFVMRAPEEMPAYNSRSMPAVDRFLTELRALYFPPIPASDGAGEQVFAEPLERGLLTLRSAGDDNKGGCWSSP